jgi:hypothetical protein
MAGLRIAARVAPPFALVSLLGVGLVDGKAGTATSSKLFYDVSIGGHLRFTRLASFAVPYLEAGIGFSGLEGPNFEWLGGAGIDLKVWGETDALGVHGRLEHLPTENSLIVPVFLAFTHYWL